jgi:molybdate transport system substrate-binding protein
VAVASNFTAAMKEIAQRFQHSSDHQLLLSFGSTGKLYAQILNNAPFQVFLAADQRRPQLLENQGLAHDRFTYAIGKLALWSSDLQRQVDEEALRRGDFKRLALTNPKTAPYGAAAQQVLERLGLSDQLKAKQVYGDNIAQTRQFAATGNAEMGFIALAQIALNDTGRRWEIPAKLYDPIRQDAVLLAKGKAQPAAVEFMDFLHSDTARDIILKFGYGIE